MAAETVVPGVTMIGLGMVNAFLVESEGGLTLVDTGTPGSQEKILNGIREIGREPTEVERIVVTHLHYDHSGSLAPLKAATGAPAAMHALDARMVARGEGMRPAKPGPGLVNKLMVRLVGISGNSGEVMPAEIEQELHDGEQLWPGGLQVVYAPGHTIGQVALLLPGDHGGVLFAADAAANMFRLGYAPIYEDLISGKETLRKLASMDFEVACFGHGGPIRSGAGRRFRDKWS
jgi:glyoxylase-like metal-dependent hydrolase (beta-lactamase superfamily II)